jgi:archaellum component FlaC
MRIRFEKEANELSQQCEGQSAVLRETHLEIARLDRDIKEVYRVTREREERKDTIINELNQLVNSLQNELNSIKIKKGFIRDP